MAKQNVFALSLSLLLRDSDKALCLYMVVVYQREGLFSQLLLLQSYIFILKKILFYMKIYIFFFLTCYHLNVTVHKSVYQTSKARVIARLGSRVYARQRGANPSTHTRAVAL